MLSALHVRLVRRPGDEKNQGEDNNSYEKRRENRFIAAFLVYPHAEGVDQKRQTKPQRRFCKELVARMRKLRDDAFPHVERLQLLDMLDFHDKPCDKYGRCHGEN